MSTLRIGTLESLSGSNSVSQTTIFGGTAKAWNNIASSGGTPSINDSFNVSSITDNGVGIYTSNLSAAFANTSYVQIWQQNAAGARYPAGPWTTTSTTSAIASKCTDGGFVNGLDYPVVGSAHGDLA